MQLPSQLIELYGDQGGKEGVETEGEGEGVVRTSALFSGMSERRSMLDGVADAEAGRGTGSGADFFFVKAESQYLSSKSDEK